MSNLKDEGNSDEEDEEGFRFGFMFGNLDEEGELDEDYLGDVTKEQMSHFSKLAGQFSFLAEPWARDLDQGGGAEDALGEADFTQKAPDAVDYEDIEEEYDGPGVVDVPLLSSTSMGRGALSPEEDYDAEEPETADENGAAEGMEEFLEAELEEQEAPARQEPGIRKAGLPAAALELPILFADGGNDVLSFSQLFAGNESYWVVAQGRLRRRRKGGRGVHNKVPPLSGLDLPSEADGWETDEEGFRFRITPEEALQLRPTAAVHDEAVGTSSEEDEEEGHADLETSSAADAMARELARAVCIADEVRPPEELLASWETLPLSANLDPIHQEEWETRILGLTDSEETSTLCLSSVDSEGDSDTGAATHANADKGGASVAAQSTRRGSSLPALPSGGRPVSIELLDNAEHHHFPRYRQQPQCLRLESASWTLPADDKNRRLLSLQWLDAGEHLEDWLQCLVEEDEEGQPLVGSRRVPLIQDLGDPHMVFWLEDPGAPAARGLEAHAAALLLNTGGAGGVGGDSGGPAAPAAGPGPEAAAANLLMAAPAKFNFSNDRYYMNKKGQKAQNKKRSPGALKVVHAKPALALELTKPRPSNMDSAHFHRPRALWFPKERRASTRPGGGAQPAEGLFKVMVVSPPGRGHSVSVAASWQLSALLGEVRKKWNDIRAREGRLRIIHGGQELVEGRTLAAQKVAPLSVLYLVRTRVHPLSHTRTHAAPRHTRPPNAFKKKQELSAASGQLLLFEYCEERPALLSNAGMGARLVTYYRKESATDTDAASALRDRGLLVMPLEPEDPSPFLGNLRPREAQASLETNMARAPAFNHSVPSTDFVLVRSSTGRLLLRRADGLYALGQQEPHIEVPAPLSKASVEFQRRRFVAYVVRNLRRASKKEGRDGRDSHRKGRKGGRLRVHVSHAELCNAFPGLGETLMRKHLRGLAELRDGAWVLAKGATLPPEEQLRLEVPPESVCAHESMLAGVSRLKRMGIVRMTSPAGLVVATAALPDEALVLATAAHIERELQLSPWSLTSNFVAALGGGRNNLERLEISGAGDPSGRGLGFSFCRPPTNTRKDVAFAGVEKAAAAARGTSTVTGTDADLRRLSMDAAKEVLLKLGVTETQIEKWTRWERIAAVRRISSEHAASSGAASSVLHKFARGQRMSYLQAAQQLRERCQEIWERQKANLSSGAGEDEDVGSDGGDAGDLDSFAGDLENLLEAVEVREPQKVGGGGGGGGGAGGGARRRAWHSRARQQEAEDEEDEEAEAAELRRMLLEDEEQEKVGAKGSGGKSAPHPPKGPALLAGAGAGAGGGAVAAAAASGHKAADSGGGGGGGGKGKKRVQIRKTWKVTLPDGTTEIKTTIITDPLEIAKTMAQMEKQKGARGLKAPGKGGDGAAGGGDKKKKKDGRPLATSPLGSFKGGKKDVVCNACHERGHMRTNRKCPLYREDEHGVQVYPDSALQKGLLKSKGGLKLSIDRKKFEEFRGKGAEPAAAPLKVKLKVKMEDGVPAGAGKRPAEAVGPSSPRKKPRDTPPSSQALALGAIIKEVLGKVKELPVSTVFLQPVNKRELPDYYSIIKKPIDLATMGKKASRGQYGTVEAFKDDCELMRSNCYQYNRGINDHLLPQVDEVVRSCYEELECRGSDVDKALEGE